MAGKRQRQVLFANADAVISHLDQPRAARFNIHLDALTARINGVFDQLFGD